jgi:hypothetical protein
MDFDRLCKDILGLESRKRFAGVCDDSGEIKYGGQREEKAVSKSILDRTLTFSMQLLTSLFLAM